MRDSATSGDMVMMPDATLSPKLKSGGGPLPHLRPRSTEELAELLRHAPPTSTYRIVGAGSWPGIADRITANSLIDLSGLHGITEYVPGDLTLTARAGTPLSVIAATTAAHGQWLPLDPWGADDGTLGATLATASAGPLSASIGLPRDAALGITVVDAAGTIVTAGGRVVKNVAGFDLVRLHVGAWGTLGILCEVTVRLRPMPAADRTFAIALPRGARDLATLLSTMQRSSPAPLATELVNAPLAAAMGLPAVDTACVRWGGAAAAVMAAGDDLARTAHLVEIPTSAWAMLRSSEPHDATVVRYSTRPSELPVLWHAITHAAPSDARLHATVARGVVRVMASAEHQAQVIAATAPRQPAIIVERGFQLRRPPTAVDRLNQTIRGAHDPARRLNPGLMDHARA